MKNFFASYPDYAIQLRPADWRRVWSYQIASDDVSAACVELWLGRIYVVLELVRRHPGRQTGEA